MDWFKKNKPLSYAIAAVVIIFSLLVIFGKPHKHEESKNLFADKKTNTTASIDSAAESLDTLTAELSLTKQQITQITKDNALIKSQNQDLLKKLQGSEDDKTKALSTQIDQLKNEIAQNKQIAEDNKNQANKDDLNNKIILQSSIDDKSSSNNERVIKKPYYTIPANATAVDDKLMTALVGRIPVKGVVTDPYPFKIVFSDDTLAANGLRVPHLQQMIVSGYSEGDLNLLSVRGWVTSLTFVFDDGTITTTSSNSNDIGHFTKENALGYLSDPQGNPFVRGKLITNAPTYLTGNIALGAAQGAASAYAQEQTTNQTSPFGSTTSSITGSPGSYVLGNAGVDAAKEAQQWWHDREENSFDAIYVPSGETIVVNFSKEIEIDYDPQGRKINYESDASAIQTTDNVVSHLD